VGGGASRPAPFVEALAIFVRLYGWQFAPIIPKSGNWSCETENAMFCRMRISVPQPGLVFGWSNVTCQTSFPLPFNKFQDDSKTNMS
jgi:hypothetical protein